MSCNKYFKIKNTLCWKALQPDLSNLFWVVRSIKQVELNIDTHMIWFRQINFIVCQQILSKEIDKTLLTVFVSASITITIGGMTSILRRTVYFVFYFKHYIVFHAYVFICHLTRQTSLILHMVRFRYLSHTVV